ncbi:uncharacterized protein LOC108140741 isoform X2 [Drosophila elegans]|uniref:uncharacterized protein LOC108140741 isoform X2 n=1 Tax=Drosophila elegans TaxID=30023 RepID=UPI001BC85E28|nr:uncharacterized protein LOC108140741 isoform X2 [Drosophila elegans]
MGKKYKSKTDKIKKKVPIEAKKAPETSLVAEPKCPEPKDPPCKISMEVAKKHEDQMSALASMPQRLDQKIQRIKAVQQQFSKLHLQQLVLLDDCIEFLQELNAVQPGNVLEQKIFLDTFVEVNAKLSEVFENILPAQLEMLRNEPKILHLSNQLSK